MTDSDEELARRLVKTHAGGKAEHMQVYVASFGEFVELIRKVRVEVLARAAQIVWEFATHDGPHYDETPKNTLLANVRQAILDELKP